MTIPACVTNVGWAAFAGCDGLVRDGFIIVGGVVYGYNGTGGDIVIPDGVTRIDNLGHRGRPLNTVFKSVRIPKSVVKISSFGCFGVRSLLVADDNPSYIVVSGLLLSKDKTTLVKASSGLVGTVTIPDEVVRIEDGAFADCCDLSEITIPRGTSTIGDYAFSGCSSLKSVTILAKLEHIGWEIFRFCYKLKNLTLQNGAFSLDERFGLPDPSKVNVKVRDKEID